MNYKLYTFILTLTLTLFPALQAMRATRSLLATARALRTPALQAGHHALAQTHSTHNNGHGYHKEEPRSAYGNYSIPTATAIAIGLGLNADQAMEESEYSELIRKLDITDIKAVLEVFKNGTEDDKRIVAEKVAHKITHYELENIIILLESAHGRPHRMLVNAIAKNITHFTIQQIAQILQNDAQDETHDLIASALDKNYTYFTNYSLHDYLTQAMAKLRMLRSNAQQHKPCIRESNILQYAEVISYLKVQYRARATKQMAQELNIDNMITNYHGTDIYTILREYPENTQKFIITAYLKNAYNFNGGAIADHIRSHVEKVQKEAYDQISKEWNLSEQDWAIIWQVFNEQKALYAQASPDEQYLYLVQVNNKVKDLITTICNERGIKEKIIIQEDKSGDRNVAASLGLIKVNNKNIHELSINPTWRPYDHRELRLTLEHELGGHARHYHPLLQTIIFNYIYRKFLPYKNIYDSTSFFALRKAHEYEADLSSCIDDLALAITNKEILKDTLEIWRPELYMTNQEFYKEIAAIINLKAAERYWYDTSDEAYYRYGVPAYDRMVFEEPQEPIVAQESTNNSDNLANKKD